MSNYRDFRNKNTRFTGTTGIDLPVGTTAQRATTFGSGTLRFNSTTGLMEYYTGTDWKAVDAPPVVTAFTVDGGSDVTSANVDNSGGGTFTIEVKGSLFDTVGGTISFLSNSGNTVNTQSLTRNSANLFTTTVTKSDILNAEEPYDIVVTNGSGLAASLADAISVDTAPTFSSAAGSLGTFGDGSRSGINLAAGATDAESDTVTHSISSGSIPAGLSFNTTTGAITGTADAVGTNTTSSFTVSAATTDVTSTRAFTITINAPVITSYSSNTTFTVPSGQTTIGEVLVVGGGGGGGASQPGLHETGGAGGAGGLIYRPGFPVSPGASLTVTVGPGGSGRSPGQQPGGNGSNSVFGSLTAQGGGGGGGAYQSGQAGGSGGGASPAGGSPGPGQQGSQPGDSGTYGFGNPGGNQTPGAGSSQCAAGGGGAGGAGEPGSPSSRGGNGGAGKTYSISGSSTTYAGGGGGAGSCNGSYPPGSGGSGGGASGGGSGTNGRGGGGGGGRQNQSSGSGGKGVVIIKY